MGITGAAIATLITCFLSLVVQQWIVLIKIKGSPYSLGLAKAIFMIIALLALNVLLPHWSSNPFVDGIYRTLIIGVITLIALYKLKISDEISVLMDKIIKRR
jgi:O-antigen/teichoic acid export membrane protein